MYKIGVSLLGSLNICSFVDCVKVIESLKKFGISIFEIPFFGDYNKNQASIKMIINEKVIFSVHADKNLLDLSNIEFIKRLLSLGKYLRTLECKILVIHPSKNISLQKILIMKQLLPDIQISFENTLENDEMNIFLDSINEYMNCSITIDIAHACFNKTNIKYINSHYLVTHFHVRGYSIEKKYKRFTDLDNSIWKYVLDNYDNKVFILEYPYDEINEIANDFERINYVLHNQRR